MLDRTDVTAVFARGLRALVDGMESRAAALIELFGLDEFREDIEYRRAGVRATDRGFLKRELFVAVAT